MGPKARNSSSPALARIGLASAIGALYAGSFVAIACSRRPPPGAVEGHEGASSGLDGAVTEWVDEAVEAGIDPLVHEETAANARASLAAGTYEGPFVGAMNMVTSVLSTPAWPENDAGIASSRLGYLRHGGKAAVLPFPPIVNSGCPDGWYELVIGGYVCGRAVTTDLKHPRVRLAPSPPDLGAALPYKYGYNVTNGTPLYRRVLSMQDRKKYEPWLSSPAPVVAAAAPVAAPARTESEPSEAPAAAGGSEEGKDEAVATRTAAMPIAEEGEEVRPPVVKGKTSRAAPVSSAPTPWFMREMDGGRPKITLDELHGRGVLVRRMVRGFYLALDKEFKAANAKWWRTTGGLAVPFERIMLQQPRTDFHGTWIDRTAAGGEIDAGVEPSPRPSSGAVVLTRGDGARKYLIDPETKKVSVLGAPMAKRRPAALTGEQTVANGGTFQETTEGFWVRSGDVAPATTMKRPDDVGPTEKWIDVDLTRQMLIAFEGDEPVFATLISSGRRNRYDKEHDYPTPVGTFRIREKHVTATMDGDIASDGPYSIEDVPWVMYYHGSYALHGAFWHAQFGHTRSHGCINLSPEDARNLFNWVEPRLPSGWHGVFVQGDQSGTTLVVHEDADKR